MDFETVVKEIRKLYSAITGKDVDVTLTFKGTDFGLKKCWHLRCDARESNSDSYLDAANILSADLQKELLEKTSMLEKQANHFRNILDSFAKN